MRLLVALRQLRRLIGVLLIGCAGAAFAVPSPLVVGGSYATVAGAMAACNAWASAHGNSCDPSSNFYNSAWGTSECVSSGALPSSPSLGMCVFSHGFAETDHYGGMWAGGSSGACTSPKIANPVTGHCEPVASCVLPQVLLTSTNSCVTPPTCASGDTVDATTNLCKGPGTAPTAGNYAPVASLNVAALDAAGNPTYNPVGSALIAGNTLSLNCGGWECTVSKAEIAASPACFGPDGGTAYCDFTPKYTGNLATISEIVAQAPGGSNGPIVQQNGCPAGYVLNASTGVCTAGVQPATASTATSAGTDGSPGVGVCPTGFTPNGAGVCSGPAGSGFLGATCPAGYTLAGGVCTGTSTPGGAGNTATCGGAGQEPCSTKIAGQCGGAGQPACSVGGQCGGAGQPACEIDWGSGQISGDPSDASLTSGNLKDFLLSGLFGDLLAYTPSVYSGVCPTSSWYMFGRTYTFDGHCSFVENFRDQLTEIMGVVWALAGFFLILGA